MSTKSSKVARSRRVQKDCQTIRGAETELEIDTETDDYDYYCCVVKGDFEPHSGHQGHLTTTALCYGQDQALNELDRMLCVWARQVESGQPMTNEGTLEIFPGPHEKHRNVLQEFIWVQEEAAAKEAVIYVQSQEAVSLCNILDGGS
jgi:hypothetical protein